MRFGFGLAAVCGLGLVGAACSGEDPITGSTGSTGAGPGTSSTGTGGSGGGAGVCATSYDVDVDTAAKPGAELAVEFRIDDPGAVAYAVSWSASAGSLAPPSGSSTTWTLPADLAVATAEIAEVTAVATAEGCPDLTVTKPVTVDWPLADRTLVIENPSIAGSSDVAAHYAAFRGIAADHRCPVAAADITVLPGAELDAFHAAVMACVAAVGEHVHYLVPVWGVPYKVSDRIDDLAGGSPPPKATVCLDAVLVYGDDALALTEPVYNGLYRTGDSMTADYDPYVPFGELAGGNERFLVARIDGADADAAKALVDRTAAAEMLAGAGMLAGTVYVDGNRGLPHPMTDDFGSYESGEWNIIGVETVFTAAGTYPIVADYNAEELGTAPAPLTAPDALYYAGWYSYGNYNDVFTWNPGAIGGHLDSCSACDIRGDVDWSARALRRGITATFGAVNEPYVAGMPEYDQLFEYLLEGATYGEAAYESTRIGAWMVVWVGDPLYRPYPAR